MDEQITAALADIRTFMASSTAKNPVDPFIDPEGYRAFIDAAEAELRSGRTH